MRKLRPWHGQSHPSATNEASDTSIPDAGESCRTNETDLRPVAQRPALCFQCSCPVDETTNAMVAAVRQVQANIEARKSYACMECATNHVVDCDENRPACQHCSHKRRTCVYKEPNRHAEIQTLQAPYFEAAAYMTLTTTSSSVFPKNIHTIAKKVAATQSAPTSPPDVEIEEDENWQSEDGDTEGRSSKGWEDPITIEEPVHDLGYEWKDDDITIQEQSLPSITKTSRLQDPLVDHDRTLSEIDARRPTQPHKSSLAAALGNRCNVNFAPYTTDDCYSTPETNDKRFPIANIEDILDELYRPYALTIEDNTATERNPYPAHVFSYENNTYIPSSDTGSVQNPVPPTPGYTSGIQSNSTLGEYENDKHAGTIPTRCYPRDVEPIHRPSDGHYYASQSRPASDIETSDTESISAYRSVPQNIQVSRTSTSPNSRPHIDQPHTAGMQSNSTVGEYENDKYIPTRCYPRDVEPIHRPSDGHYYASQSRPASEIETSDTESTSAYRSVPQNIQVSSPNSRPYIDQPHSTLGEYENDKYAGTIRYPRDIEPIHRPSDGHYYASQSRPASDIETSDTESISGYRSVPQDIQVSGSTTQQFVGQPNLLKGGQSSRTMTTHSEHVLPHISIQLVNVSAPSGPLLIIPQPVPSSMATVAFLDEFDTNKPLAYNSRRVAIDRPKRPSVGHRPVIQLPPVRTGLFAPYPRYARPKASSSPPRAPRVVRFDPLAHVVRFEPLARKTQEEPQGEREWNRNAMY
ncbi:hypothetical protein B0H16DRAFT_1495447 [Mycena metata]|uniref:Zn(2)-C6 fungal-type domain-containing protein n=1 Tax=Mycena metata TaxID=1033252 RepID=A0AAD7KEN6_9AGAR|nr:hypothetical protein B0H16DRAFT_1495447 [Mycena metata]